MKHIKTYENYILLDESNTHRYEDEDFTSLNIDTNKFLIDFDYTFDIVKKINPELENNFLDTEDWCDECEQEFIQFGIDKDGDWDEESDEIQAIQKKCFDSIARWRTEVYMEFYKWANTQDRFRVYRTINVNHKKDIDYSNLGIYWSFKPTKSLDIGQLHRGKYTVNFKGFIEAKDVNWIKSLANFIYFGDTENEVNLNEGTYIKPLEVEIGDNDEKFNIPLAKV